VGSNPSPRAKMVVHFRLSGLRPDEGRALFLRETFPTNIVMKDTSTDLSSDYRLSHEPETSECDLSEFAVAEHEPPSASFHSRSPGQLPSRKLNQSFIVRNIADVAEVALLVFCRANVFASCILSVRGSGAISRPATLLYPAHYLVPRRGL